MTAILPLLLAVSGCAALGEDPKRTNSLPNDSQAARVVSRCHLPDECRSPDDGVAVQPGESLDFKLYFDESRTYVVGDAQGKTLGCVSVPVADGAGEYPDSLSDLTPCPPGTRTALD